MRRGNEWGKDGGASTGNPPLIIKEKCIFPEIAGSFAIALMKLPAIHPLPDGRLRIATVAELRKWEGWQRAMAGGVKDHRYYEIVAETLGFDCRAAIVEDTAGEVRAVQTFFFAIQDLVVTAPQFVRTPVAWVRKFFPNFLQLKMLMVGCAAGEGKLGAAPEQQKQLVESLREPMLRIAKAEKATLVVWKDFPTEYRPALTALKTAPKGTAHVQFASMPATSMALEFTSFDDYMAKRLSHAMRKNLRRKFKALAKAAPVEFSTTTDLGADAEEALGLYLQVFGRSPLQFEKLNLDFLRQLTERMPDRVRYFLWRQEGRLIAFSLCLVHDGAIYDEYLGLDYRVALDLHLYFVTFRDVMTWALQQGLKTYYSTPLNYDPKLHLDFALKPLDLYFALPWAWVNPLAHPLMRHMGPTGAEPVLKQFANAKDMDEAP